MKPKIGILTTYFATNFGAVLQPFAMKRTLEQYGYDVEIIRYKQPKVFDTYKPFSLHRLKRKNVFATIQYLCTLPVLRRKAVVYQRYLLKHLQSIPGFCEKIPQNKDFYFFGSDQIWNPCITGGFDDIYFGRFPTKLGAKKIAYAASAEGIEYNEEQVRYLREQIWNFDHVGVREQKLADDLKRVTGREDIVTVLDPTLVADLKVYDEIEQINPLPEKKYVLFYKIRDCMIFMEKIYQYARSVDVELLILSSWYEKSIVKFAKLHDHVTYLPEAGVEIFLGSMKNAEVIFTPSFHGCVFSILFARPFYSLVLSDTWNTRANDLLVSLGLENRMLKICDEISSEPIDFLSVGKKLDVRRKISLDYIRHSLNIQ